MNANLTLDQRVNRGIKKIKELFPGEEMFVKTIQLSRCNNYANVGIGKLTDIDRIFIELVHKEPSEYQAAIVETPIHGEFFNVEVIPDPNKDPNLYNTYNAWPLPYSLDDYIEKLFTVTSNRFEGIYLTNSPTDIIEFKLTDNFILRAVALEGDNYAINVRSQTISIPYKI